MPTDAPRSAAATAAVLANKTWLTTRKCSAIKKDGIKCGAIARRGSDFCPRHAAVPRASALVVVKRIRAGSPQSFSELIAATAEDLLAGRVSPQQAAAMASLAHAGMKAFSIGDLERQVADLERQADLAKEASVGPARGFDASLDFGFPSDDAVDDFARELGAGPEAD